MLIYRPPSGGGASASTDSNMHAVVSPSKNLFSPALREDKAQESTTPREEPTTPVKEESESEDEDDVFNPYLFIALLPSHEQTMIRDKVCLPAAVRGGFRQTLALDLDETLVHCTVEAIPQPDLVFPVK